ncbi:hypothetical protein AMS62_27140 [Bacillus sp. FJAT-18019]|nr:hypothetical protein AMS62_27140 [Bacillus sp. FJAT-18019]
MKKDGYAYRTYDECSLKRLEQILILRRLRIPLKEIQRVLQSEESKIALNIFQEKIQKLSQSIKEEDVCRLTQKYPFQKSLFYKVSFFVKGELCHFFVTQFSPFIRRLTQMSPCKRRLTSG